MAMFQTHEAWVGRPSSLRHPVVHCASFFTCIPILDKISTTSVFATYNLHPEISAAKTPYLVRPRSITLEAQHRSLSHVAVAVLKLGIVWKGVVIDADDTSFASPIFASVVSLLNGHLVAACKPVLGFFDTPSLSTGTSTLNDISADSILRYNIDGASLG